MKPTISICTVAVVRDNGQGSSSVKMPGSGRVSAMPITGWSPEAISLTPTPYAEWFTTRSMKGADEVWGVRMFLGGGVGLRVCHDGRRDQPETAPR
eukprot:350422-Chlamydomonas_euryale.AAC.9